MEKKTQVFNSAKCQIFKVWITNLLLLTFRDTLPRSKDFLEKMERPVLVVKHHTNERVIANRDQLP